MKKEKRIKSFGYSLIRPFLKLFSILVIFPQIINKKNIPKKGGYILAGTHKSYYDPIIIGNLTIRPIHFMAKKELFNNKVLGSILHFMGIISVDRSTKNPDAKKEALQVLNEEKVLCIFPEGTCNKVNNDIIPFKYGAVSFAQKTGKPIIPFAIEKKCKPFRYRVKVIVGNPFYVKKDEDLEKANKDFENIVLDLLKEVRR